jgi:hypothetical protein
VLIPWAFTRQQNALIYVILLPVALTLTWRGLARPVAVRLTLGLALLGVWCAVALAQNTPQTQLLLHYNATEVIQNRIGLDPSPLAYLRSHGTPLPSDFASQVGHFTGTSPLLRDAQLRRWIVDHFDSTYLGLLIHHPYYAVGEPLRSTPKWITDVAPESPVTSVLSANIAALVWGPGSSTLNFWIVISLAVCGTALQRRRIVRLLPISALLGLSALVGAVITYDLATIDLVRLMLPVAITTRITLILLIACGADALLRPPVRPTAG